jgi:acetyl esterase/lipase
LRLRPEATFEVQFNCTATVDTTWYSVNTHTMDNKTRLPFGRELESLLPDFDELIWQSQTPVRLEDVMIEGVDHEEHTFTGSDNNTLTISIFRKERLEISQSPPQSRKRRAVYHIHGGGMIMSNRFCNLSGMLEFVRDFDAICTTIEYRLAPENPYPVPLEDYYAGPIWVFENTERLGIDEGRIAINGLSAGGGFAAGVALLHRDRRGPGGGLPLAGQSLFSPMLDDVNDSSSAQEFQGVGIWDRDANMHGWNAYLGARRGTDEVDSYALDLSNLPHTYLDVGSTETLHDEGVAYAQKLWRDGTQCELHVWPGAYHGFEGLNRCGFSVNVGPPAVGTSPAGGWHTTSSA